MFKKNPFFARVIIHGTRVIISYHYIKLSYLESHPQTTTTILMMEPVKTEMITKVSFLLLVFGAYKILKFNVNKVLVFVVVYV